MGFFSSIGNFISQNVQSVVQDVGHAVGQVTQIATGVIAPVMSLVQPIVAFAGGDVAGGMAGLQNMAGGPKPTQNTLAPTGNAQTDAINQLNANQQALAAQNQQMALQLAQANAGKENKFLTTLKENLYWFVGGIAVLGTAFYFAFRPNKRRR